MEQRKAWAMEIAERIYQKEKTVAARSKNKIPYLTEEGIFDDWSDRISWWTNGFYGGLMWQLYHAFGDECFRTNGEDIEDKLDKSLMDYMGMDHDSGFKWLLTSVANYKMTGNGKSKNRALLAAANLAGRFNLQGRFIRAWNDGGDGNTAGLAIIDCMMNLPLLYWATEETKDSRFAQIAVAHADTAVKHFLRKNGSVNHIVCFDPDRGTVVETLGGQGMEVGSSWTRGQAWAVYGFALSYRHTGNDIYLDAAKKVGTYFCESLPQSGLVPVDFKQDPACDFEDDTAAAIAACGLLEIASHVKDEKERTYFYDCACNILETLSKQRCNWSENVDYLLEKCSVAYHDKEHNFSIVYGDYFFTEAILKLCGKELFLW